MTRAIQPTRASNMPLDPPAETAAGQRRRSAYKPSDQEGDSATVRAPMGT